MPRSLGPVTVAAAAKNHVATVAEGIGKGLDKMPAGPREQRMKKGSVNQSVFLPGGDPAGIERLVGYMTRCPLGACRGLSR